jgi:hypothetical protein
MQLEADMLSARMILQDARTCLPGMQCIDLMRHKHVRKLHPLVNEFECCLKRLKFVQQVIVPTALASLSKSYSSIARVWTSIVQ